MLALAIFSFLKKAKVQNEDDGHKIEVSEADGKQKASALNKKEKKKKCL